MPRKRIVWTEKKINAFIKEGRGQGCGEDYQPWIQVGEFSSLGRAHRIKDVYGKRMHHFFSDLEKDYYYFLLWKEGIQDIREQFPLFPIMDTERIAESLNIRHPQYQKFHIVMTTDFLITYKSTYFARSIKMSEELEKSRVREKIEIEKCYWKERGIDFKIVTEKSFSRTVSKNVEKLLGYYEYPLNNFDFGDPNRLILNLIEEIANNENRKVSDLCTRLDKKNSMNSGSHLSLFLHLGGRKIIPMRIEEKIVATKRVNQIVDVESLIRKEEGDRSWRFYLTEYTKTR